MAECFWIATSMMHSEFRKVFVALRQRKLRIVGDTNMAQVTTQMIKELRERTLAGMGDCKSALVESEGNMDAAIEIILKKGLAKEAKRAGAATTEGVVTAQVLNDGKSGVIVEVNIQTDFSARNENFTKFVDSVLLAATKTAAGQDLLQQNFPGTTKTVEEYRKELAGTIGENIQVRRWARYDSAGAGFVHSYVHMGGKIGVLVEIATETPAIADNASVKSFSDDVAMQIAAMAPRYLESSSVPAEDVAKQVEIFEAQLKEEGKPEAAWAKIIEGKKRKWFTEVCLLEQDSVIVSGSSIDKVRADLSKTVGGNVTIKQFTRFERGEGISKKEENFADEVNKLAGV
jgi:elongation factor Ts